MLLCAQRRLTAKEMLAAVTVDSRLENAVSSTEAEILDVCCNFVLLDEEVDSFRFAHLSVREYLEKRSDYYPVFVNLCTLDRCLSVFLCDSGDLTPSSGTRSTVMQQNDIFRRYSTVYWPIHCQLSQAEVERNTDLLAFVGNRGTSSAFEAWANSQAAFEKARRDASEAEQLEPRSLIDLLGYTGPTPLSILYISCAFGLSNIVNYVLLRHGLHWNHLGDELVVDLDFDPYPMPDYYVPIQYAIRTGHSDIVQILHEHQPGFFSKFPYVGATALVDAITESQLACAKVLLDMGIDVDGFCTNTIAQMKFAPLNVACRQANLEMVQLLLSCNANPNIIEVGWNSSGRILFSQVPLFAQVLSTGPNMSKSYQPEITKLLVEAGADIKTPSEDNLLHHAAWHGDMFLVSTLVKEGVDLHGKDRRVHRGKTPLHCAAQRDKVDIMLFLVEHGLDIYEKDIWGRDACEHAVKADCLAAVEACIALGLDPLRKDGQGSTMMHTAARYNAAEVVRFFLGKGLFPVDDETFLIAVFRRSAKVVRLLLNNGANANSVDERGQPALYLAIDEGSENAFACVQMLLDKGASVDDTNKDGDTPLYRAVYRTNLGISRLLLERGADGKHRNHLGYRPLDRVRDYVGDEWGKLSEAEEGIRDLFAEYYSEDL